MSGGQTSSLMKDVFFLCSCLLLLTERESEVVYLIMILNLLGILNAISRPCLLKDIMVEDLHKIKWQWFSIFQDLKGIICAKKVEKKVSHTGFEWYYFSITYTILVFLLIFVTFLNVFFWQHKWRLQSNGTVNLNIISHHKRWTQNYLCAELYTSHTAGQWNGNGKKIKRWQCHSTHKNHLLSNNFRFHITICDNLSWTLRPDGLCNNKWLSLSLSRSLTSLHNAQVACIKIWDTPTNSAVRNDEWLPHIVKALFAGHHWSYITDSVLI